MTPRPRTGRAPLVLAIVLAAAGCSAATPGGPVFAHVHGLGIDPADGSVQVATHDGLFRSGPDGLVPVGTNGRDLMGFTVAGPGVYLCSGHPGPDDELPDPLGLVQSRDGGATWTSLSLTGDVDFHALEVAHDTVFGYDATNGLLRLSTDGGQTWSDRATLDALDIAVDPDDPNRVLATVEGGVAASTDGGQTFVAPDGPQLTYISWAPGGVVYGLDLGSRLFTSDDGGSTWEPRGTVPGGRPQAITATGDEVLAATAGGVYRTDDGLEFTAVG